MPYFNYHQIDELEKYLYQSCDIHDAQISKCIFNRANQSLHVSIVNPTFNTILRFTFYNVSEIITVFSKTYNKNDTILSLTAEKDCRILQSSKDAHSHSFHIVLQMLSGDEMHLLASHVLIEGGGQGDGTVVPGDDDPQS